MPRLICRLALLVCLASGFIPNTTQARAETSQADRWLLEHSSDVFFGTVDIVTAGAGDPNATEYTILTTEVLKGNLTVPSLIVVRQEGDGSLIPKAEYLFFAYYDPAVLRYVVTDSDAGVVPVTSTEQRAELAAHWSDAVEQAACIYPDVLMLDGVVYARRDWNEDKRYLERDWVGPAIATVERQDTAATGCRADLGNRSASVIPVGTKVQELKGYAPAFRVAVRMPDRHRYLYEAIWSETAKTGADLLDFRGRVIDIEYGRYSFCNDRGCVDYATSGTDNHTLMLRITDEVLAAPVAEGWAGIQRPAEDERGYIRFTLDDGSTAAFDFHIKSGVTANGIQLPPELLKVILRGFDTPDGF